MKGLRAALKEAQQKGFIDTDELPECFGSLDDYNFNCTDCPLNIHCENELDRRLAY